MELIISITLIILSYLLGSIPFGLIITKYYGYGDIRKQGSGNIGATNVLRNTNKTLGALTLILDSGKGAVAVLIANIFISDWSLALCALAAILGHIFPYWLKFKGGKGVATTLAVYLCLYWPMGIFACISWLFIFYITRMSSLSSIGAMIFSFVFALFMAPNSIALSSFIITSIIIYRHKDNIIRFLRGEELTFGEKKA